MQVGSQDFTMVILVLNRQLEWTDISLVYDKTHKTSDNLWQQQCQMCSRANNIRRMHKHIWGIQCKKNRKFETSNDFKNFYWTSSLLLGTTTMCNSSTCIPSNMRKTQYFRNCLMKTNILAITQTKESTLTQSWQWQLALDRWKKQRGGFLLLLGKFARPIFLCAASSIGLKLLEGIGKK